jgi:hypothetical protein
MRAWGIIAIGKVKVKTTITVNGKWQIINGNFPLFNKAVVVV